jgi:hypothetical protein
VCVCVCVCVCRMQVLHPKTLQGLDRHHISFTLHDAVCKLLEAANKARQAKWVADGGHSKAADPLALPPIPAPAEREDMSGLWGPSPSETKVKRTLEEKYVDAALSVVSMLHGERRGRKTPEQIKHISRSMGLWQVMIECKFVHRAMCAGLAALSMHLTAEVAPGIWEPAPAVGQDVVKRILEVWLMPGSCAAAAAARAHAREQTAMLRAVEHTQHATCMRALAESSGWR